MNYLPSICLLLAIIGFCIAVSNAASPRPARYSVLWVVLFALLTVGDLFLVKCAPGVLN